jgi:hypothetical protein
MLAGTGGTPEARGVALMKAWPAFVELAGDVTASDGNARRALVAVHRLAFSSGTAHGERLIKQVLADYRSHYGYFLTGLSTEMPTWDGIFEMSKREASDAHAAAQIGHGATGNTQLEAARAAKKQAVGACAGARRKVAAAQKELTAAPNDAAKKAAVAAAEQALAAAQVKADAAIAALSLLE